LLNTFLNFRMEPRQLIKPNIVWKTMFRIITPVCLLSLVELFVM
jgi:hypothetical protein